MKMPMNNKVEQLIKKELNEILELGFLYETIDKKYRGVVFREIILKRDPIKIKIKFYTYSDVKEIYLWIERIDMNVGFSLEEYLKYNKLEKIYNQNSYQNETDEEYISRYFKMFNILLENDLMDFILGKKIIEIP